MSKRRLVDTNLIVRYLVQDHEKHAKAAGKLFDACDRGDVVIVVLPAVLAECVFVLSLSTSTRVETSPQRSADSFPARVSKLMRRFTWTLWIAIEKQRSISWTA